MCVYSMVIDHGRDTLRPLWPQEPWGPGWAQDEAERLAKLEQAVQQINDLLRRAKIYDEANDEPDCELEEKKAELQALADRLGVTIEFP